MIWRIRVIIKIVHTVDFIVGQFLLFSIYTYFRGYDTPTKWKQKKGVAAIKSVAISNFDLSFSVSEEYAEQGKCNCSLILLLGNKTSL